MKKTLCALLALCLLAALLTTGALAADEPAAAADIKTAQQAADYLYSLGLFRGTGSNPDGSPVYELERTPTRFESVAMLVRLLGAEDEALAGSWRTPFRDLYPWAAPYVGYAYAEGLTNGTSADTYDGSDPINASQYLTFVLRALGYESGVDFQWQTSWQLTNALGITAGQYVTYGSFSRGDAALVSARALSVNVKGQDYTLYEAIFGEAEDEEEPPASTEPIATYSGRGDDVITGVNVPKGDYYVEYTCTGEGNFIVDLYYGSGALSCDLVANDIGASSGRMLIDTARSRAITNGRLEIMADGGWTIQIKPVGGTTTTNMRGSGDAVTGVFTATTSRATVSSSATGAKGNFIVYVYELGGAGRGDLVANLISPESGRTSVRLVPGEKYFLGIDAGDAEWSIDFGLGGSVTRYDFGPGMVESEEPEDPGYDDPGDDPGDEPGSEKKWSYDDVTRLKGYIEDAQGYLNSAGNYAQAAIDNRLMSEAYMNNAKSAVEGAQRNYENALTLMSSRVELTYESGGTMAEKIQGTYDNLASALDIPVEGDPYDYALDFMKIVANAMGDNKTYIYNVGQLYESMLRTD